MSKTNTNKDTNKTNTHTYNHNGGFFSNKNGTNLNIGVNMNEQGGGSRVGNISDMNSLLSCYIPSGLFMRGGGDLVDGGENRYNIDELPFTPQIVTKIHQSDKPNEKNKTKIEIYLKKPNKNYDKLERGNDDIPKDDYVSKMIASQIKVNSGEYRKNKQKQKQKEKEKEKKTKSGGNIKLTKKEIQKMKEIKAKKMKDQNKTNSRKTRKNKLKIKR